MDELTAEHSEVCLAALLVVMTDVPTAAYSADCLVVMRADLSAAAMAVRLVARSVSTRAASWVVLWADSCSALSLAERWAVPRAVGTAVLKVA